MTDHIPDPCKMVSAARNVIANLVNAAAQARPIIKGEGFDVADAILSALTAAGYVVVPVKLLGDAHACMRETGWHLAPAHAARGSDGILEAACAEVAEQVGELLAAAKETTR